MDIKLKENEVIDDLEFKGLKIIQNKKGFCFGIDSILLSDFAKNLKEKARVADLGTGTGIISLLLCAKTNLEEIIGIEVQEEVYEMAQRSILLNNLESKFKIINQNILDSYKFLEKNSFDAIVTNPPYKKRNTGLINDNEKKFISRHEITANLEDFIRVSKDLLKDKGEFYMVHRTDRLVDILGLMRKYKLEPKVLRLVYSSINKEPKLVLVKGVKYAKPCLIVQKNLYIYKENGEYTDEIKKIYNK